MTLREEIKDTRISSRLRRANIGLRYPSSSSLVPSAIHNTNLHTLTILSNTCNLPYHASTVRCKLCLDLLQAQPSVVGGEAGMAKHAPPMCLYHRAYNTFYLVNRCMGIDYYHSIQEQYIHVHRKETPCSIFGTTDSCNCVLARKIMRLSLHQAHARGAQICTPYVPGTMTFFSERSVIVTQAVGR